MLDRVFKVSDAVDYNEVHQDYTSLGTLATVAPGAAYTVDANVQGYSTTFNISKRGKEYQVHQELMDWGKEREIFNQARMQGDAVRRDYETMGALVYNKSTNTAYTSYGDAKPLGSTIHPLADGSGTFSNASSTGITLTEDNLETAILSVVLVKDMRGQARDYTPTKLIVPSNLAKEALVILKSTLRSDTANNDANVYAMSEYKGGRLDVVVWKYLDSTNGGSNTRWFLLDGNNHMVQYHWGKKPQYSSDASAGFHTDTLVYKCKYEFATGWGNPRGFWVSNGDGAAYSD
jgi:hypothetical protein